MGVAVRAAKASHEDDNLRQAKHDDVGNPLICRLHLLEARNVVNDLSSWNKTVVGFNQVITLYSILQARPNLTHQCHKQVMISGLKNN